MKRLSEKAKGDPEVDALKVYVFGLWCDVEDVVRGASMVCMEVGFGALFGDGAINGSKESDEAIEPEVNGVDGKE